MSSYPTPSPASPFHTIWRGFGQQEDFSFANLLSPTTLERACADLDVDFASGPGHVWTPALTVWAWLWQCLSRANSCVAAVARVLVLRVALAQPPCAAYTGAYCKARAKLPVALFRRLTRQAGQGLEDHLPPEWRWHGRRALVADGSRVTLADTPENRAAYPQCDGQAQGVGFPQLQMVVLLALASGALLDLAEGPCRGKQTGETALLRQLLDTLRPADVLVADRLYCAYWLIAWLRQRQVDPVVRQPRSQRFARSQRFRLGPGDYWVRWVKPARCDWMDEAAYEQLPTSLFLRVLHVVVPRRGYRTRSVWLVTTLLDDRAYPRADLAELYARRWCAELDLRTLKQDLQLEPLRCRTPEMVRKDLWAHWLGYNLVRQTMAEAARQAGVWPRQLSFAGAVQTLVAFRWALVVLSADVLRLLWGALWQALATHRVGGRPGRYEPRQVKKARRKYPKLSRPRAQARAELAAGQTQKTGKRRRAVAAPPAANERS
jgi:hypothetical protein